MDNIQGQDTQGQQRLHLSIISLATDPNIQYLEDLAISLAKDATLTNIEDTIYRRMIHLVQSIHRYKLTRQFFVDSLEKDTNIGTKIRFGLINLYDIVIAQKNRATQITNILDGLA